MGVIKINNIIYGSNNSADIIYKNTTVEEKLNSIPVFDPSDNANIEGAKYDYLTYGHIVDALNSSDTSKVLSANQGRILKESIESVTEKNSEDIEDLTITVNTLKNIIPDVERLTAKTLEYDDSKTNLGVNNVQDAIDEQDKNLSDASNYTLSELFAMCPSSKPRVFFCNWDSPIAAMMNKQNAFLTINNWTCIATTYTGERYQANAENLEFTLCGLRTGVDANGNYGYYKDGADTVTPFNNIKTGEMWLRCSKKITTSHNYTGGMTGCFYIDNLDFSDIDSFVFSYSIGTSTKNANVFRISNSSGYIVNVDPAGTISNQTVNVNNTTLPCTVQINVSYQGTNYLTIHSYKKHGVTYVL